MEDKALHVPFNPSEFQTLSFDIGQKKHSYYTEFPGKPRKECLQGEVRNRRGELLELLTRQKEMAKNRSGKSLLVVCEPTGGYEKLLMTLARQLGLHTAYVSGMAVHRLTAIESNDSGKSDQKDPRTIFRLAELETPLLNQRELPSYYRQLRLLNGFYEDEEQSIVQIRTRVHALVRDLFCDFSFENEFIFTKAGDAFFKLYQFNPHLARKDGKERFIERMKGLVPKVQAKTFDRLWEDIESSARLLRNMKEVELLAKRLGQLLEDWAKHMKRKVEIRTEMLSIFEHVPEYEFLEAIPKVENFLLARIVAETGPLQDFRNADQLLRFAGLNLRERQSGKYKGLTRISKKGRALLRKVLYQMAFGYLIKKKGLLREYYETKVADLKVRKKAMVAVMRKFLRLVFGMSRRKQTFSSATFFRVDPAKPKGKAA
jgi:transposase